MERASTTPGVFPQPSKETGSGASIARRDPPQTPGANEGFIFRKAVPQTVRGTGLGSRAEAQRHRQTSFERVRLLRKLQNRTDQDPFWTFCSLRCVRRATTARLRLSSTIAMKLVYTTCAQQCQGCACGGGGVMGAIPEQLQSG